MEIIVFISSVMTPLMTFLLFRRLLDDKKTWTLLIKISISIALLGIALTIFQIGKNNLYLSLATPLFSFSIYRILFNFFLRKFKRPPIDTAYNWTPGLFYDRLFNIIYFFLSTLIPVYTILYLPLLFDKS